MRYVEWFGGIGAFTQAIKRNGIKHTLVDYVELDKNAVKSFNAINDTNFTPTDINNVDINNYGQLDLIIAGWPCQDYSVAGKQLGTFNGERSNLILITINKINEMAIKPKHILLENVKGLLSPKFKDELIAIKNMFYELGYKWEEVMLNSKYFGVPQSRERVFILLTRKDLPIISLRPLQAFKSVDKVLSDILDFCAPCEEIILTDENHLEFGNFITLPRASDGKLINGYDNRYWSADKFSGTINSGATPKTYFLTNTMSNYNGKTIKLVINKLENQNREEINKVAMLGSLVERERERENSPHLTFQEHSFQQKKDFLGISGVSKTLRAGDCDAENKVIFEHITFKSDKDFIGVNPLTPTLVAQSPDLKNKIIYKNLTNKVIKYRKLTPKECWILMGFSKEAFDKAKQAGISDSQLCKQAGNSIVVNVLQEIIKLLPYK